MSILINPVQIQTKQTFVKKQQSSQVYLNNNKCDSFITTSSPNNISFKGWMNFFRRKPKAKPVDFNMEIAKKFNIPPLNLENPKTLLAMFGGILGVSMIKYHPQESSETVAKALLTRAETAENFTSSEEKPCIEDCGVMINEKATIKLPNGEVQGLKKFIEDNSGDFIQRHEPKNLKLLKLSPNVDIDLLEHIFPNADIDVNEMSGQVLINRRVLGLDDDSYLVIDKSQDNSEYIKSEKRSRQGYFTKTPSGEIKSVNTKKMRSGDMVDVTEEIPTKFVVIPKDSDITDRIFGYDSKNTSILLYESNSEYMGKSSEIDTFLARTDIEFCDEKSKALFEKMKLDRIAELEEIKQREANMPINFRYIESYSEIGTCDTIVEMPEDTQKILSNSFLEAVKENPKLEKYKDVHFNQRNLYTLKVQLNGAGKSVELEGTFNYKTGEVNMPWNSVE